MRQPDLKDDRRVVTFVHGVSTVGMSPVTSADIARSLGLPLDYVVIIVSRMESRGYIEQDHTRDSEVAWATTGGWSPDNLGAP